MHNTDVLNQFVQKHNVLIESSIALEKRNSGLLILDAYFGLDEHIYQIDAGLLIFKMPKTVEEYLNT